MPSGHQGATDVAGLNAQRLTDLALAPGSSSLTKLADGSAIDAGGLIPDLHDTNSWVQGVGDVDALELLEVQLCNSTAPFILINHLRPQLAAAAASSASESGRAYVVNVSAMEGVFSRGYKGPGHPHTNMAKAAVNMLTRTSAREMFDTDRHPHDERGHRMDYRRTSAPHQSAAGRGGISRPTGPCRWRGTGL